MFSHFLTFSLTNRRFFSFTGRPFSLSSKIYARNRCNGIRFLKGGFALCNFSIARNKICQSKCAFVKSITITGRLDDFISCNREIVQCKVGFVLMIFVDRNERLYYNKFTRITITVDLSFQHVLRKFVSNEQFSYFTIRTSRCALSGQIWFTNENLNITSLD